MYNKFVKVVNSFRILQGEQFIFHLVCAMEKLPKLLVLALVIGATIMMLTLVDTDIDQQIIQLENEFCNSKSSDVQRIITVIYDGQLGNNIWEYMSLLVFMHLYKKLNFTAHIPVRLKDRMEPLFERVNIPEISKIPKSCLKQEPYLLRLNESFQCDELLNKSSCPLTLDTYSARYKEIIQYGIDKLKNELRFQKKYVKHSHKVLNQIKTTLNISENNVTFVGMHYRGNEYINFLKRNYNMLPHAHQILLTI